LDRDDHRRRSVAGNDTPPHSQDGLFSSDRLAQRIHAVVYGAVGCLPRALRGWAAMICHGANLQRLTRAMTPWILGGPLDKERFGRLFLGRDADDPLVALLHDAAPRVGFATGHAELGDAATKLAAAILLVGPDRWSRFLAELESRALDPATAAEIEGHAHHGAPTCPEAIQPADLAEAERAEHSADEPGGHHAGEDDPRPANPVRMPSNTAPGRDEYLPPWRMPSPGIVPPVRNPSLLRPGTASRPAWSGAAGRSLWDEEGGEWQYNSGDDWHNPHWDYNAHSNPNTPWRGIPISGRSPWNA
jgi:hypothetical protein